MTFSSLVVLLCAVGCLWFGLQESHSPMHGLCTMLGWVLLFGFAIILSSAPNTQS